MKAEVAELVLKSKYVSVIKGKGQQILFIWAIKNYTVFSLQP